MQQPKSNVFAAIVTDNLRRCGLLTNTNKNQVGKSPATNVLQWK